MFSLIGRDNVLYMQEPEFELRSSHLLFLRIKFLAIRLPKKKQIIKNSHTQSEGIRVRIPIITANQTILIFVTVKLEFVDQIQQKSTN
jgi:hypothetical protein